MNLRQIGDIGANALNQPGNHIVKERFKDSFKRVLATRIRQTIERNGIDDMFKMSFNINLVPMINGFQGLTLSRYKGVSYYNGSEVIPYPVRFSNDAPFTRVSANGKALRYVTESELRLVIRQGGGSTARSCITSPSGGLDVYLWRNRNIIVVTDRRTPLGISNESYTSINIESIWPDPEELLMRFDDTNDGQEITIPIADDQVETIIAEILKTEYNLIPREANVVINPGVNQQINNQ